MIFYTSGLRGFLSIWSSTNRIIKGVLGGEHVLRQNIGKSYDNAQGKQYYLDMKIPHELDFSWTNLANLSIFHPNFPNYMVHVILKGWKPTAVLHCIPFKLLLPLFILQPITQAKSKIKHLSKFGAAARKKWFKCQGGEKCRAGACFLMVLRKWCIYLMTRLSTGVFMQGKYSL